MACLILLFVAGCVLGSCGYFLLKRLAEYTVVTLYEVPDEMVPVDRDLLTEITHVYERAVERPNAYDSRRQVRLDLASIRNQLRYMLNNSGRARNWAFSDRRIIMKNNLDCSPDAVSATDRLLSTERELRTLILRALFRVWLWSLSNFHAFDWGPLPDIRKLDISKMVDLYEKVRLAAINLARCYGEAAMAEEIDAAM